MPIRCLKALEADPKREPHGCTAACSGAAWEISFMRGRKEAAADSQLLSIKTVHGLHQMFLCEAAPPDCWRS